MSRGKRPGCLYEFEGYHPKKLLRGKLEIVVIYDGQTRQRPEARWWQHQFGAPGGEPGKCWWPLVTKKTVVCEQNAVSDQWLDAHEALLITKRLPIANIMLNMLNPKRIPPWEMKALMAQIGKAGGVVALVRRYGHRSKAFAGWSIGTDGSIEFYGVQSESVERVRELWTSSVGV